MKFIIVIYNIYILIIISVIVIHGQDNNVNNNNPDDPMFQGHYKAVKGGVGAAFTEGADWDGLKDADKTVPPDFKTTGLPSIDKQTDDFEGKMQKQAQNDLDKSTLNLPTITKNFHKIFWSMQLVELNKSTYQYGFILTATITKIKIHVYLR